MPEKQQGRFEHQPVLVEAVLKWLAPRPDGWYVDATVGGGGHAEAILEAAPGVHLVAIDRDAEALEAARRRLERFGDRVRFCHACFSRLSDCVREAGCTEVDGVLFDLGVSSHQIDAPERGFSYRFDGPLDMRMDRRSRITAASLLNTASEEELADIFRTYGEERFARRIARAVVRRREERPWARTGELADLVNRIVGRRSGGIPPPTRVFQALRIAVNDELRELEYGLREAVGLLRLGGRIVTIAFHSLEDRIVKHFFRDQAAACVCPPWFPECRCGRRPTLRVLTKRPVRPSPQEIERNPRSSAARLRAAERIEENSRSSDDASPPAHSYGLSADQTKR